MVDKKRYNKSTNMKTMRFERKCSHGISSKSRSKAERLAGKS